MKVVQLKPRTSAQKDKAVIRDKSPLAKVLGHAQECAAEKRTAVINHEGWGFVCIDGKAWMFSLFKGLGALVADDGKAFAVDLKKLKLTHAVTLAIGYEVTAEAISQVVVVDFAHKKERHSYRIPEPAMQGMLATYCVTKGCNLSLTL